MCWLRPFLWLAGLWALSAAPLSAQSYRDQAREAAKKGRNEEAVELFEKALRSSSQVFKDDDLEITIRRAELGEAYRAVGRYKEAIAQLDYAWKRSRYDAERLHRWTGQEGDMAMNCGEKLARACQAAALYEDALMVFRTLLQDNEKASRAKDETVHLLALLADTLLLVKQDEDADAAIDKAVKLTNEQAGFSPRRLAQVCAALANIYYFHERYEKARPLLDEAVKLSAQHLPPVDDDRIRIQQQLAEVLIHEKKFLEADLLLQDALKATLRHKTQEAKALIPLYLSLSQLALAQQKAKEAIQHAEQAQELCDLHFTDDFPARAQAFYQIGQGHLLLKQTDKARAALKEALLRSSETLGADHPQTREIRALLLESLPQGKSATEAPAPTPSGAKKSGKTGR